MKPEINVLIFDFDGVIVDSGRDIANAVCYTLKCFNRPMLPEDEIISYLGRGPEVLIRRCFKDCDEETVRKAVPIYKDYYINNCMIETKLYKNVEKTLECFKDKKIAVVTNKPEDMTYKLLDGLKVREYFKMVVGPESVQKQKPHPEGLLKVLSFFGEKPEKAIMVGDSNYDIEAGKGAGTYTCGMSSGLGSTDELINAGPDFIIDDMIKLTRIIE